MVQQAKKETYLEQILHEAVDKYHLPSGIPYESLSSNTMIEISHKVKQKCKTLVRNKIPKIIENDGKTCEIEILSDEDYIKMIDAKLDEELAEYHKDQNLEELADLLEVIYAATIARGYSVEELEELRAKKAEKRGGFKDKIFLKKVIE